MNKFFLLMLVAAFSFSALACDGHGGKDEEDKKFVEITESL